MNTPNCHPPLTTKHPFRKRRKLQYKSNPTSSFQLWTTSEVLNLNQEIQQGNRELCLKVLAQVWENFQCHEILQLTMVMGKWSTLASPKRFRLYSAFRKNVVDPAPASWVKKWIERSPSWFTKDEPTRVIDLGVRVPIPKRYSLPRILRDDPGRILNLPLAAMTDVLLDTPNTTLTKVLKACKLWPRLRLECWRELKARPLYWIQHVRHQNMVQEVEDLWNMRRRYCANARWWFQVNSLFGLGVHTRSKPLLLGKVVQGQKAMEVEVQVSGLWGDGNCKVTLDYRCPKVQNGFAPPWWVSGTDLESYTNPRFHQEACVTIHCSGRYPSLAYEVRSALPHAAVYVRIPSIEALQEWVAIHRAMMHSCASQLPDCCHDITAAFLLPQRVGW
jgi:hypothetical protein